MSLGRGIGETDVTLFGGSLQRLGDYGTPLSNGLYSQNCAYSPGQVSKRLGHSVGFTITGAATSLYNWLFYFHETPVINALYYKPGTGLTGYQLDPTPSSLPTLVSITTGTGASVVTANQRLYVAVYDSTGRLGVDGGQVYGWNIGADPLFAAPMANTQSISEPSAGVVTAGVHRIAYLPTTRNGFTTKMSPVIAGLFTPTTFTASGSKNLQSTISGTFPAYMDPPGQLQLCMTTTDNLNKYYTVPGAVVPALSPATITVDIDDDDLAATGTDVTDQINLLTCTETTAPYGDPFVPSAIFAYSNRLGYCTIDAAGVPVVYMSEKNDYQHLTADQNAIYLEASDKPVQGISIGGVCYIGSPSAFYSCTDSGDVPALWTPPQKVQGSVGILSPTNVSVDAAQTRALIAAQQGLYLFQGGQFPQLPISYYQGTTDWARIDWTQPTKVQVVEDQTDKKFIVIAPLAADSTAETDIQAAATYEMSWDYTQGDTPDTVKYSINPYTSYSPASIAMILNPDGFIWEPWTGPASSGPVIRRNDGSETHPYADVNMSGNPVAIKWLYQLALVPGENASRGGTTVHDFHGAHFRAIGDGNLDVTAYGLDATGSVNQSVVPVLSPLALSTTPGQEYLMRWYLRSEQQSVEFGNDAVDEWATVSLVRVYWTNSLPYR